MQATFWHEMWASGVVGFHQTEVNPFLSEYWQALGLTGDETVLVPLCGKSLDMLWLAEQGHTVLGVELSQQALDEFLIENKLAKDRCIENQVGEGKKIESQVTVHPVQHEHYCGYQLEGMTLLCGDFFHLSAKDCQTVKAVYDRAAIVALPAELRAQYVAHLRAMLPKGTRYLMVTMAYDQALVAGPPFSVPEAEVYQLFSGVHSIRKLHEECFVRKGVTRTEMVFVVET